MGQLSFQTIFDDNAHGARVTQLTWRPRPSSAEQLVGLWNEDDGSEAEQSKDKNSDDAWWSFNAEGGRQLLFRSSDLFPANRPKPEATPKVHELRWLKDGDRLLALLENSFRLFDVEARRLIELPGHGVEIRGSDPKVSPDGQRLAFVRDNDLYVLHLDSGEVTRLTDDGKAETIFNGATDWVYWEELWGRASTGHWWSPDGQRLAFYHFDDSDVGIYTLVDTSPLYPTLERQRYPKAGEALPRVEVRVFDFETGHTTRLDTGDDVDIYLPRVHWHPDGEQVVVERLNRAQTRLDLVSCHRLGTSGDQGKASQVLTTQTWPTWINLAGDLTFLKDGRFLWSTEETGWRQLYLYEADGHSRRRLTPDGWCVSALHRVDEDTGWFIYQAHCTDTLGAAERHVFRGDLAPPEGEGARATRLTEEAGWHDVTVASDGRWVDVHSHASSPAIFTLRDQHLETRLPRREPSYDISRLPHWRHLTIPGPGGQELPAQILQPLDFDPSRQVPVIMYHYGCPTSQVVHNRWTGGSKFLWDLMMAERGYALLCVDSEASTFFGKHGEDKMHRRFGEYELATQLAGVEYLRSLPWVDSSRIGLWGWSGGGASTLYCMLRRPGVWKAGVAGAPVTDWRYYDAIWIERFLGHPESNEDAYQAAAPLTYAPRLRDPLLLVHGTADNNVHPQNSLNLAQAFIDAGVQVELALYPGARHGLDSFPGGGQRHLFERMTSFFDRHLDGPFTRRSR